MNPTVGSRRGHVVSRARSRVRLAHGLGEDLVGRLGPGERRSAVVPLADSRPLTVRKTDRTSSGPAWIPDCRCGAFQQRFKVGRKVLAQKYQPRGSGPRLGFAATAHDAEPGGRPRTKGPRPMGSPPDAAPRTRRRIIECPAQGSDETC
jgi:hypothetical protein